MAEHGSTRTVGGVRLRTTAAATVVVALVLAAAFVALVLLQRHQLTSSLTDAARQQASDVARQASTEGAAVDLVAGGGDQSLIQVVDAHGRIVSASQSIDGEPPVVSLRPAPGQVLVLTSDRSPIGEGGTYVVVARGTNSPDGPLVILTAQSLETVQQSTSIVIGLLAIGYPLVLLAVALTSYWLAGLALAPVEAIRRRVAGIEGAADLTSRVPVPGGDDEIARLARTMNSMLARLQEASEAQKRFIGDASHELKSPLATIRAAHEISTLHPGSTDWSAVTPEVLAELDRVDRLVGDMLVLARGDEHGLPLRLQDVDLDDLLDVEAQRLRGAGLHLAVTSIPVRVVGDHHYLSRALRNLTDNAARHATNRVELRLHVSERTAVLDVVNDGPAISEQDRERVFDRFVRLDESRDRHSGGTGLGLPIARQIARGHGGDVVIVPTASGVHFALSLPLAAPPRRA